MAQAVRPLKSVGVVVTAGCDTEHVKLARGLGADTVFECAAEDSTQDGYKCDVVLQWSTRARLGEQTLLKPTDGTRS
jgi:hypothetical protein